MVLVQPLEPRRQVHAVADDRVVELVLQGSDVSYHHLGGIDPDADAQVGLALGHPAGRQRRRGIAHRDGAVGRAVGMVGVLDRLSPERHHRVADELVEGAARVLHDRGHLRQVLVEELDHLVRLHLLGNAGEAADVAEQDAQLGALAAEVQALGVLGQLGHVLRGDVFPEHLAICRLRRPSVT